VSDALPIALYVLCRRRRDRRRAQSLCCGDCLPVVAGRPTSCDSGPTRANWLLSGGREAVKTVWQTASIVRKEGFGAAVRSSIEDLADWAEVERPDLARVTPDGR